MWLRWLACVSLGLTAIVALTVSQQKPTVSYTKDIQPLFLKRCVLCHGENKAEHNLRLDSYEAVMQGDKEGAVIVPGKSSESRLYLVVAGKREPKMPPDPLPPLTPQELELLRRWIDEGAKNDAAAPTTPSPVKGQPIPSIVPKPQRITVQLTAVEGIQSSQVTVEFGPMPALSAIAFSPDGKTLFVGGYREVVRWDLSEGKLMGRWNINGLEGSATALAINKDGTQIAIAGGAPQQPTTVAVLDAATGKILQRFTDPKDTVPSITFSPDGNWLAAASVDKFVYVWDLREGKLAATLKEHSDWVLGVAFSHDGKWLATSSADRTVLLWEANKWQVARKLEHPETVYRLAFQPNGNLLAAAVGGLSERGVWIWNAETGQRVRSLGGMKEPVLDVAWSSDGKFLVAGVADNTVRLYDANGNLRATLQGHGDWVNAVAFHPDNNRFASASNDGTVRLWHIDGRLLAVLVQLASGKNDWLIITPQGYFAHEGTIQGQLATMVEQWRKPEMVRRILAGEKLTPAKP